MTKYFWFCFLPFAAVLCLLGGCTSPAQLGDIYAEVLSYKPADEVDEAILTVQYSNHNVYPIALKSANCKLYLNHQYVGSVREREPVGMPKTSIATRTVKLRIEKPAVIKKILASPSPVVEYRLDTVFMAELMDERTEVSTSRSGQLDAASFKVLPAEKKTIPDAPTK